MIKPNNLNLIRLFAAIQVMFLHGREHLKVDVGNIFNVLEFFPGVPIFFVISGYLIYESYEKSNNLYSYYKNRVLRIYPALWVCFFISCLTVFFITQKLTFEYRSFVLWSIGQITFVQFYNPVFLRDFGVGVLNGSLWTISVELQFYLLVPILYGLLKKTKWSFNSNCTFCVNKSKIYCY